VVRDQHNLEADIQDRLEGAISGSSLILFTMTTLDPYLADEKLFEHSPTVLHLSLRDICVNVILTSQNIVDDVDHCLKANTSLHLTEMAMGNRNFVSDSLVDVLEKKFKLDHDRPRIFSPFGLGVLDLAAGNFVLEVAKSSARQLRYQTSSAILPDGDEHVRHFEFEIRQLQARSTRKLKVFRRKQGRSFPFRTSEEQITRVRCMELQ